MAKFDFKVEENTNTGEKMLVASMQGELVSIAKEPLNNVKGTAYYALYAGSGAEQWKNHFQRGNCAEPQRTCVNS